MRKRPPVFLPSIVLDRTSREPLHRQIARLLGAAIRESDEAWRRMPSTRMLARLLGVSRNTVLAAYEELTADGQLEPQRGSGMHIVAQRAVGGPRFDLARILRAAHFPRHPYRMQDPDGTEFYLNASAPAE